MLKEATANLIGAESLAQRSRMRRFTLQMALRYRVSSENMWRRGETENISGSGVLFRAEFFAGVNTSVELCLTMPAVNSDGAAEVRCRGRVVRALAPEEPGDFCVLAVEIFHFRFVRP